ncbi:MAG: PEP-CTERM sorting domain-containing protein [Planctomycetia bacterium]|nr:PEP-CTERM sorting domain-containing protein [Planctomycetia bacterium]
MKKWMCVLVVFATVMTLGNTASGASIQVVAGMPEPSSGDPTVIRTLTPGETTSWDVAVYAGLVSFSYSSQDSFQVFNIPFTVTSTSTFGQAVLTSGLVTLEWVNEGIDDVFANFYQSGYENSSTAFSSVYTSQLSDGSWTGSINVRHNDNSTTADLKEGGGNTEYGEYRIGTIRITYNPDQWTDELRLLWSDSPGLTLTDSRGEMIAGSTELAFSGGQTLARLTLDLPEPNPIPEPGTWAMMTGMALVGGMFVRRRGHRRS